MYRIFIVEDDPIIASEVEKALEKWGFEPRRAVNFARVTEEAAAFDPHLVLLDITLPNFDGYYWCREIRKTSRVPVMFFSSASDGMNVVMAMNMGGDDFVSKPFDLAVLLAKIQALLRRAYDFAMPPPLEAAGARLNTADATLEFAGQRIELTKNEMKILEELLRSRGAVVSRDALMERLWETDCFVDENTLSVNVARLRKKLDAAGLPAFIVTKKGLGYLVE